MRNILGLIALLISLELIIFLEIASSLGSLSTITLALTTTFIAPLILRDTPGKIIEGVKETFPLKANPAPQIASEFFKLFAGLLLLLPGSEFRMHPSKTES